MDQLEAALRTRDAIVDIPARFMMDRATYEHGGTLGYAGIDFYFAGRGGLLGDVPGGVVAAAFVFFNPDTVCEAWERAAKVGLPADAARALAAAGHAWAEEHLPSGVDHARLAELTGRVAAASSPSGAPLFAGWRALPEPASAPALALHNLNALRELRGGLHGGATLAEGLLPQEAVAVKTPFMLRLFGWGEAPEPTEEQRAAWERAEAATNRAVARGFAALDPAERAELVDLAGAIIDA